MDDLEAAIMAGAATALRRRAARQAQIAANWTAVGERGALIRSGEAAIALRISTTLHFLAAEFEREAQSCSATFDRRTSTTGLSPAMREVRVRNARDDIYLALGPVSRLSEASRLCLELDDDVSLNRHFEHLVECMRHAVVKHRELKALQSSPPVEAAVEKAAAA